MVTETKTKEQKNAEWAARERGAIWASEDKLSIVLKNKDGQEVRFIAFRNRFKSEDKHPDWRVYTELPKENSASTPKQPSPKPVDKPAPVVKNKEEFV